jgi:hypothetical protein
MGSGPEDGSDGAADSAGPGEIGKTEIEPSEQGPPASEAEEGTPSLDVRPASRHPEVEDQFYHGVIAAVNWSRGTGVVRSGNGRDIAFEFPFVIMVGPRKQIEHLHPGMRVGFDVGWTSKGLRVTMIKIYD